MLDIIRSSQNGNGAINGRGLAHRKLWPGERVALAADVATKQRAYDPSLGQLANIFGVSVTQLRAELKVRAAEQRHIAEWDEQVRQAAERWAAIQAEAEAVNTQADEIVAAWNTATPEAREAALRTIGVGNAWEVIAKVVA